MSTMRNKILFYLFSLPILMVSQIWAQTIPTISTNFRTDLEWRDTGDKSDSNLSRPTLKFFLKRAHLTLNSDVDEKMGYRIRLRWNQSFEPQPDNAGLGLEQWYLKYQWSAPIQIRLGKQRVQQGGREGVHNPIDVFQYSQLGERLKELHEVGVSAIYDLGDFAPGLQDQTVIAQIMNQPTGGSDNQFKTMYNVAWYGVMAEGLLEPVAQYALIPHAEENKNDETLGKRVVTQSEHLESLMSFGMLVNLDEYLVEIDLLVRQQTGYKEQSGTTKITHGDENESSVVIYGEMEDGPRKPFVKWIYDSKSKGSKSESKTDGIEIQVGTEYFPKIEYENFRLHGLFRYRKNTAHKNNHDEIGFNVGASARF